MLSISYLVALVSDLMVASGRTSCSRLDAARKLPATMIYQDCPGARLNHLFTAAAAANIHSAVIAITGYPAAASGMCVAAAARSCRS